MIKTFVVFLVAVICVPWALAQGTYRNQRLFAVPCSGEVKIDGDLRDWDLSGQILTFVSEATLAFQSAKTAVMYDDEAFYLASEIADPSPMMNRHNPAVNPDFGWDADAFQFRMCLNPQMGYPIKIGRGIEASATDNLVHMLFWYYTDDRRPVLHLKYGMDFHDDPKYPKGIVPAALFEGAYRRWDDGQGYTLEYRIPWSTLGGEQRISAGDLVAGAMQLQWSNPTGDRSVGSGWGVDVLRMAGFSYQTTACWGKIIFTDSGNLPKQLTQEGLPPTRELPLRLPLELPEESVFSLTLINDAGDRVRNIVAAETRPAGAFVESWDGLDDAGRVLPPGDYTWKGVYHEPLRTEYVLSVGNSGEPGYKTLEGTGGWGGDWGNPADVCWSGDVGILSWDGNESGSGIIKVDSEAKKQFGIRYGARYLATDGQWVYAYLPHEKQIRAYTVADGSQANFERGELWAQQNREDETHCSGLAWQAGKLYAADDETDTIVEYDARQGTILRRFAVPNPTWVAAGTAGELLVISGGLVLKLSLDDSSMRSLVTDHLDQPQAVTVDGSGTIYVSNAGALHNVSVFNSQGKYLRSIGREGGRATLGEWQQDGMRSPRGMAVDPMGRLWVMEFDFQPKRVSVWNAESGALLEEKFGACYVSTPACMDPTDPTRVYCQNVEWTVDLDEGSWRPAAVMIRPGQDRPWFWPHMTNNIAFTANNGQQYMHARFYASGGPQTGSVQHGTYLFVRRGDHFEAVAGAIDPREKNLSWRENLPDDDPRKLGWLWWEDRDGDGRIDADETRSTKMRPLSHHSQVGTDLSFYTAGMYGALYWQRIVPKQIREDGVPFYDDRMITQVDYVTREEARVSTYTHDVTVNPADGSVLMYAGADIKRLDEQEVWPLTYWTKEGELVWRYRQGCRWYHAYELPIPKPGQLWGSTKCIGITDGITGFSSYHGLVHLLTTDGVVIGTLMQDGRSGITGHDEIKAEWFTGQLVKTQDARWFFLGGDQDGRVLEVFGLNSLERLDGELIITKADSEAASRSLAEWSRERARSKSLVLARTQGPPDWINIRGVMGEVDSDRRFTAKMAYDAELLHVRFEVQSPNPLTNRIRETQQLFKGGNCLDLQIATDPNADPNRSRPTSGDLRLLVTRRDMQPLAVLYRPKIANFRGTPSTFTSPTGEESFDSIEILADWTLDYEETERGFNATLTVPLAQLSWQPRPGTTAKMDVGYLFGDKTGSTVSVRSYWSNGGFTAGVTNDVPHESRLEPHEWGTATIE